MSLGWFDGEIKPAGWFHPIAAGGIFDETLIAQSGGSGAITGTLAATDAADVFAASGLLAHTGALSAVDSADSAAAAGVLAHVGDLTATDGTDSAVMAGILGHVGDMVAIESADSFVASGFVGDEQTTGSGMRRRQISPAYAKRLIEARLRTIAASSPKKPRQKAEHAPVGIDSIAQQAQDIARTEREALIDAAVREVIAMQSRLDAQIKAEFAAIEIAAQLAIFEEEMLFMFMVACEA